MQKLRADEVASGRSKKGAKSEPDHSKAREKLCEPTFLAESAALEPKCSSPLRAKFEVGGQR